MSNSGNIAYTVRKENWGRVFETEIELVEALLDEKSFRSTVNEWKISAEPGAAEYEDNDEIVKKFDTRIIGRLNWHRERNNLLMESKAALLNFIFRKFRLKK